MTDTQIDLEDAIASAEKSEAQFRTPLQRKAPPKAQNKEDIREAWAKEYGPVLEPRTQLPMKEQRVIARERLTRLAQEIEQTRKDAKPGTALHAELSVRTGQRAANTIFRMARSLAQVTTPNPDMTHPTRERVDQAGEDPQRTVARENGHATGVKHRWVWPVEQLRREWLLKPHEVIAAKRFRDAVFDQARMPRATTWDDDRARGDPAKRDGLTPGNHRRQQLGLALAGGEAGYVWKNLQGDRQRGAAWSLILEEAYPGHAAALGFVELGRALGGGATDAHCRWLAKGMLVLTCERLAELFLELDRKAQHDKETAKLAQQRAIEHQRRAG